MIDSGAEANPDAVASPAPILAEPDHALLCALADHGLALLIGVDMRPDRHPTTVGGGRVTGGLAHHDEREDPDRLAGGRDAGDDVGVRVVTGGHGCAATDCRSLLFVVRHGTDGTPLRQSAQRFRSIEIYA